MWTVVTRLRPTLIVAVQHGQVISTRLEQPWICVHVHIATWLFFFAATLKYPLYTQELMNVAATTHCIIIWVAVIETQPTSIYGSLRRRFLSHYTSSGRSICYEGSDACSEDWSIRTSLGQHLSKRIKERLPRDPAFITDQCWQKLVNGCWQVDFFETLIGKRPGPIWKLLSKLGVVYAMEPAFTILFVTNMVHIWEKVMANLRSQIFRRILVQKVPTIPLFNGYVLL